MNLQQTEELAVLWTKAQPTVAAFIGSLLTDFHQAEDVLHQVAVILVRKFADYDRQQPFVAWAIGIARLEVLKHRRQFATDRHQFDEALIGQVAAEYTRIADELDERRQALHECLAQLHGRSQEALRLRYVEGLKPLAIATQLRMAASAARVLLHRARTVLRECIERRLAERETRS